MLLCPILLSNPPQKSKIEMHFLSCLVLHLRCCFLLEALCVVGGQAFPPLSYILYPRFLAALADQSPKSSSSIWDAPIPSDTQWAPEPRHTEESTLGLCYFLLFHLPVRYGICSLPAQTIHYSNTYANIQWNRHANTICPHGSSVPATLQTTPVCPEAEGTTREVAQIH